MITPQQIISPPRVPTLATQIMPTKTSQTQQFAETTPLLPACLNCAKILPKPQAKSSIHPVKVCEIVNQSVIVPIQPVKLYFS